MKKINLLDKALIDYLDALNDPNRFTDWPAAKQAAKRALIQWDNALFSAGVYRLAAQGEAAIRAEAATTATEDQWTAFVLAACLTQSPLYNADVFLKLSQAKTFEDRKAIRKEAGDGVHSLTKLKRYHHYVANQYGKKVIKEAETRDREDDRELDKEFKLAMIKLADTIPAIPAMMAQQAAPAAESQKFFSIKEAAEYCRVAEKTVRNWLQKLNPDGSPMLPGVKWKGREYRMPRSALEPWRKPEKAPSRKTMSSTKRKK